MAFSLATLLVLTIGVTLGYAQTVPGYGSGTYEIPVQSYKSPAKSAYPASYSVPVQSYSSPSSYKSASSPSPATYSSYQVPVQSYNAPAKSAYPASYQAPVQSYSSPSSYKAASSPSPASYSSYQAPVPSYTAPAKSAYPTTYKSASSYQAPAAPSYSASYKNSSSYGSTSYADYNVRNVRVSVLSNEFSENAAGTSQSFLTELLAAIQGVSNLRFKVTIRDDLTYPKQQLDGTWDGSILAPLLNDEADLVGTDLTSNAEGEKVVDFTQSILPYKLQVLVKTNSGYGYGSQNGLQYVIADTEDLTYLKNSPQPSLQSIASNIQQGQANGLGVIVSSNAQGVAKVLTGNNNAYIIESPFVQRALAQSSSLSVLPGDLGGYFNLAFATQLGSSLRNEFNIALLQVLQDGTLKTLLQKYNLYVTAL